MKILFLTKYGRMGSSSRYRMYAYIPYLEEHGWEATVQPLLPDSYLKSLYAKGRRDIKQVAKALIGRAAVLRRLDLREFDAIHVQYELYPHLPFLMEREFYRRHGDRVLVDYDDATFAVYEGNRLLRDKIRRVMGGSRMVVVGNQYLASYARRYAREVVMLPMALELDRYIPKEKHVNGRHRPVVGWIGTPVTAEYLTRASEAFQLAAKKVDYTLRCIGSAPDFTIPGVHVEVRSWAEATEAAEVRGFDVGVMPLPPGSFTVGKCGFKLIQCMACGVPPLGTALGANCDLIQDGFNGYLASSHEEFADKLCLLLRDPEMRSRLGREARTTVEREHCMDVTSPRFANMLATVAGNDRYKDPSAICAY